MNIQHTSVENKEQYIVQNLLYCNGVIEKLKNSNPGKLNHLFENNNLINDSLISLNESLTNNNNINILKPENFNYNNLAYFKKIQKILNDYDKSIIKNLNESFDENNPINLFKTDIETIINELTKINDFNKLDNLPKEIQKINIWAKKPVQIYGFDIVNNISLQNTIAEKFKLNKKDLISILFDKSNKQLLFVYTGNLIAYDVFRDNLDFYNNVGKTILQDIYDNESFLFIPEKEISGINNKNYINILKEYINNNIIELFTNINSLNLTFTDNLYNDKKREEFLNNNKNYSDKNFLVKIPQQK